MDPAHPLDDPLRALFSGKRKWPRIPCSREARLWGPGGSFGVNVLDISEGGILAAVEDPTFYVQEAGDGLALVERAFPDGPEIAFPTEQIRVPSSVVRITPYAGDRVALGCRFQRPLTDAESVLLGLHAARVEHPEAPMATLPFAARRAPPAFVLIFSEGNACAGPRLVGRVRGLGERVLEAEVGALAEPPGRIADELAGQPLRTALVVGRRRVWEGPAHLMDLRIRPPGSAAVLRLLTGDPLGRAVHRRFARAGRV